MLIARGFSDEGQHLPGALRPYECTPTVVPVSDVVHDCSLQFLHTCPTAATDSFGSDLGEPSLDQVQPRRVRWSEVHLETFFARLKEISHLLRLVTGDVVYNKVKGFPLGTTTVQQGKEIDVLAVAVVILALCYDLPAGNLQGGKQGGDAVALVIMALPLRDTFAQRQDGLRAFEGLDLRFLVHAENYGVLGRSQIQTDDLFQLLSKLWIVAGAKPLHKMGLQLVLPQNLMNLRVTDAHSPCQIPRGPVRGGFRLFLLHDATDFRLHGIAHGCSAGFLRGLLQQPFDAALVEPPNDLTDSPCTNLQRRGQIATAFPSSTVEYDLESNDLAMRQGLACQQPFHGLYLKIIDLGQYGCSTHQENVTDFLI